MEQNPEILVDEDGDPIPQPKEIKKQASGKKRLNKHLKMSRASVASKKKNRKKRKDIHSALTGISKLVNNKNNVTTPEIIDFVEENYKGSLEDKEVIWSPFEGPQTQFLEADEFEVLFSGGRAPGKSDALMMDALRYCQYKDFRGLVIRKAMKELRDLIKRAKELYPMAYPGTKWKEQEKLFVFPSGAIVEFGYCDHEDDVDQYKGQEYSWLGIDELTELATEQMYEKLIMSVRKKGEHFKTYVRATTNPNGIGKTWVKKRFVDMGPSNTTITIETNIEYLNKVVKTTRKWIHGTIFDNPKIVAEQPDYIARLASMDNAVIRKQWLEGDWDSADGLAFDEFSRATHVIAPFQVPNNWKRFRACDWGYTTKGICLWMATDYDGNIYVYRELVTGGGSKLGKKLAEEFAELVKEREIDEVIQYGVLDASAWSRRGETSPPPAEEMIARGVSWRPSDRTPNSRITGKLQVHKYLQKDPVTGKPKLYIFNTCTDLIACLSSLPLGKNNPEDVKDDGDDHSYDALRYGLMSRPIKNLDYDWTRIESTPPIIINEQFGF